MAGESVVLKHAVGLETSGEKHTPVFVRGLHLPVAWSKAFRTAKDEQTEMGIHILQGDSTSAADCRMIAVLTVTEIPCLKRGEANFKVTLAIDESGRFSIVARQADGTTLPVEGDPTEVTTQPWSAFTGFGGQWGFW